MDAVVRPFLADDLRRLVSPAPLDLAHHEQRLAWQAQGLGLYLVAWHGDVVVGRATVLWQSKYPAVRRQLPGGCEVNALAASPTGSGIGTALMEAAEDAGRTRGCAVLGVAVEPANGGARRFYDRLGYSDWGGGVVSDAWDEHDEQGVLIRHHVDACSYLRKQI